MSIYDRNRWNERITSLPASSSSSSSSGSSKASKKQQNQLRQPHASLVLHLHVSHCRFENQNGVFLYESPIRKLLAAIRDARLPTELLDLLDATQVSYVEGCLVVEIHDHRAADAFNGVAGDGMLLNAHHALNGVLSMPISSGVASSLGKRSLDGSAKPASAGMSSTAVQNIQKEAGKRFQTTYSRFESARAEAVIMLQKALAKEAAQKKAPTVQAGTKAAPAPGTSDLSSSVHSAVAAAVASASSVPVPVDGKAVEVAPEPIVYRVALEPDSETVWADLVAMREDKNADWTDQDLLSIEAEILAFAGPELCLAPDPNINRIANILMNQTALPSESLLPKWRQVATQKKKDVGKIGEKAKKAPPKDKKKTNAKSELAAEAKAAEEAEKAAEKLDEEKWLMVYNENYGRVFQPSFSRIAHTTAWREKRDSEKKKAEQDQQKALAQAQAAMAAKNASGQKSRAGSVVNGDIAVNAPSPAGSGVDISAGGSLKDPKKKQQPSKLGPSAAGKPGADASTGTAARSLKLTLKNDRKNKDGKADVPVNMPNSASSLPAGSAASPPGSAGNPPTAAQQVINRKMSTLPKAKLKTDVKAQAQAQAQAASNQASPQNHGSPAHSAASTATPQQQLGMQIPANLQQAAQRIFSPMPGQNQQSQQQFMQSASPQQASAYQQAQQALAAQLQAQSAVNSQIQRPTSTNMQINMPQNGMQNLGMNNMNIGQMGMQGVNINSSPYQRNMQLPQQGLQQGLAGNQQVNIFQNGQQGQQQQQQFNLPQQGAFNPYQNNAALATNQNLGQHMSPQVVAHLAALQQQSLMQHQQQLFQNLGQQANSMQGYQQAGQQQGGVPQMTSAMLEQLRQQQQQQQQQQMGVYNQQGQWQGR